MADIRLYFMLSAQPLFTQVRQLQLSRFQCSGEGFKFRLRPKNLFQILLGWEKHNPSPALRQSQPA